MDHKIRFGVSWTFFFAVMVTAVVNAVCWVLQYFSMKRMWRTEIAYQAVQSEEMEMKRDLDSCVSKKCKKQGLV